MLIGPAAMDDILTTLHDQFSETMRLLLTADLHFRIHWVRWLIEQAPNFDLVCIAGELLDIFKSETRMEQAREITRLIREIGGHRSGRTLFRKS